MLETSLKLLKKINDAGFEAYIVGGFVRDYILGIESNDVDICTNARAVDLRNIFKESCLPPEEYGSVTLTYKDIRFEITTFRKELSYLNNRKPDEIEYIDDLKTDLLRRDFTINTICMDKDKNIIDLLDGKKDLENKILKVVGDSNYKFNQDSLRILRAIRIATTLKFTLSIEIEDAIINNKNLLKNLSYQRKKEELQKIFLSKNSLDGIKMINRFNLGEVLEIKNIDKIIPVNDINGIWAQLEYSDKYPFNKVEKENIKKIRDALNRDIDKYFIYEFGLYITLIVCDIKNMDKKNINETYKNLPIKNKKDIDIFPIEIADILNKEPGSYLKNIINDIEYKIVTGKLENDRYIIKDYIINTYNNML
ncbi:MAG: hypothetical protein PHQ64_01580 [Bacilli bacterium]|nr:hypothetical protein [Bacilli bacterium]